jgi:O-antigen/teichoic acid export membrane protein
MKKAFIISSTSHVVAQVITFLSIVGLSRLLTPAEIGVFAIVSSIVFLAIELRTFGVAQFLIRQKDITVDDVRSCLGLLIILSWGLTFILITSSTYIADFYEYTDLKYLVIIVSLTFLIAPYSAIIMALLTRDMKFGKLAIVKLLTIFSQAGCALLLAYLGFSYYALALSVIFSSCINLILLIKYSRPATPYIPLFRGISRLFKFGTYATLANLSNRFTFQLPDLVIGKVLSVGDVGIFSRAFGFINFSNSILTDGIRPVILPYLSEINRENKNLSESYLKIILYYSSISLPIFAAINVGAYPVINALFGSQWIFAASIASVLAIWGGVQSIHSFFPAVLVATNNEKSLMYIELVLLLIRGVTIYLASVHGLIFIAWGMVFSSIIDLVVKTLATKALIKIDLIRVVSQIWKSILIAILVWISLTAVDIWWNFKDSDAWTGTLIIVVTTIFVWILSVYSINHSVKLVISELVKNIRRMSS